MESIYSRDVYNEYLRRSEEAKEKSKGRHGVISEFFLAKIVGESPDESESLPLIVWKLASWSQYSAQHPGTFSPAAMACNPCKYMQPMHVCKMGGNGSHMNVVARGRAPLDMRQ